jgi:hypothetical protein
MKIYDFAKNSKMPIKLLKIFVKNGSIQDKNSLSDKDLHALSFLENIWGCWDYIEPQLSQLTTLDRMKLVATLEMDVDDSGKTIYDFATTSVIPLKALKVMVKRGVIHENLRKSDLIVLKSCEKLWGCWEYQRHQISKYNKEERQRLISNPEYSKWERWAYTRMMNTPQGKKIILKNIIKELEYAYLIELEPGQIKRIYEVRKKVYNDKKAMEKKAQAITDYLPDNEQMPNIKDGCE